jgi:hypothetical protein
MFVLINGVLKRKKKLTWHFTRFRHIYFHQPSFSTSQSGAINNVPFGTQKFCRNWYKNFIDISSLISQKNGGFRKKSRNQRMEGLRLVCIY